MRLAFRMPHYGPLRQVTMCHGFDDPVRVAANGIQFFAQTVHQDAVGMKTVNRVTIDQPGRSRAGRTSSRYARLSAPRVGGSSAN